MLSIHPATKHEMGWVRKMVVNYHYLRAWPHPLSRPMAYMVKLGRFDAGLVVIGIPHASRCRGWWGYLGLRTQWQVVDISRIWLHPRLQRGGDLCTPDHVPGYHDRQGEFRPTTITDFVIPSILERIQKDRVSLWPPIYLTQPYHITLVVSYHDPKLHKGTIYKLSGARPMYTDADGQPAPGPSGKFGWCWSLDEPTWQWNEIEIQQPRTLRLAI